MRPSRIALLSLPLTGLLACGGDDGPATTYTLTFEANPAATALLAAQDGDGAWHAVALDGADHGTFEVTTGFHAYAVACRVFGIGVRSVRVRREAGAPDQPIRVCLSNPPTLVSLAGTVTPADAWVFVGDLQTTGLAGDYALAVEPGTVDVVAVTTSNDRMLVRRDVAVTADQTLDLDVTAAGIDVPRAALTVTGAGDDVVSSYGELHSAGGTYAYLDGDAGQVPVVPVAARVAGDRVVAGVYVQGSGESRTVQHELTSDTPPTFAFDPITDLAADRAGWSWSDDHAWISSTLRDTSGSFSVLEGASSSWRAAHGIATPVPWTDAPALPGWDTSWSAFSTGATVAWSVSGEDGDRAGELTIQGRDGTLTW